MIAWMAVRTTVSTAVSTAVIREREVLVLTMADEEFCRGQERPACGALLTSAKLLVPSGFKMQCNK